MGAFTIYHSNVAARYHILFVVSAYLRPLPYRCLYYLTTHLPTGERSSETPRQSELAAPQTGVDADRSVAASLIPTYLPAYIHLSTKPDLPTTVDILTKRRNLTPSSTGRQTHSSSKLSCLNKRILYQPPTVVNFLTTRAPLFSFPPSCTLAKNNHIENLDPRFLFLLFLSFLFFLPQMIPLNTSSDLSSLKPLGNGMGWNILLLFTRTLIS